MKRVSSIEYIGKRKTFDVQVFNKNHNFVLSNDLISHNSGKSLSATRMLVQRQMPSFCNYGVQLPFVTRLKIEHVMKKEASMTPSGNPGEDKIKINWAFWKKQLEKTNGFDIILDEVHNLVHSRRAMSKWNINMTIWLSQIRKILGSSEKNDIVLITQRVSRIDIAFQDLLHEIIYCEKFEMNNKILTKLWNGKKMTQKWIPEIRIVQYHFLGEQCVSNYEAHKAGVPKCYSYRDWFVGNAFMQYYNSYELIEFGDSEFL